ncbi:MAG: hypothetical protein N2652_09560 [Kiritimatiellae bacterium]|nr:hypothetical protein [Kiritimatiellia bacterium]
MVTPEVRRRREPLPIGRWLMALLRAAVIVAIFGAIGLICWPLPVPEVPVNAAHAEKFGERVIEVERTLRQRGTVVETIADEALNNYLAWRIRESASAAGGGFVISLKSLVVETRPERMRAVLAGNWGPIRLTFEVKGIPSADESGASFGLYYARLGHLTLPTAGARNWAAEKFRQVLSGLEREMGLLRAVRRLDLGEGKVRVALSAR